MSVKYTNNTDKVLSNINRKATVAIGNYSSDTVRLASMYAPKLSGALKGSGRFDLLGNKKSEISFNTAYATRRHYENSKNPSTLRYLERAGKENAKSFVTRYIK